MIPPHSRLIAMMAELMAPNIFVELGIGAGKTNNAVAPHCKKSYVCDIGGKERYKHKSATFFKMSTNEFYNHWKDNVKEQIDLIFIDADHSKEAVEEDVNNWLNFLKPDTGIMLLHDVWPAIKEHTAAKFCGDCYLLNNKFGNRDDINYFVFPFNSGLGMIRKLSTDWRS